MNNNALLQMTGRNEDGIKQPSLASVLDQSNIGSRIVDRFQDEIIVEVATPEIKVGREVINKEGNSAVILSLDSNPSILTSSGFVVKFSSMEQLLKCCTPTDYMYTEVLALLSHMRVMEHMRK